MQNTTPEGGGERNSQVERIEYHLSCALGHDLINKMSAIVGYTELLEEKTERGESQRQLLMIRHIAKSTADQIKRHVCHLDAITKTAILPKPPNREGASLELDILNRRKGKASSE